VIGKKKGKEKTTTSRVTIMLQERLAMYEFLHDADSSNSGDMAKGGESLKVLYTILVLIHLPVNEALSRCKDVLYPPTTVFHGSIPLTFGLFLDYCRCLTAPRNAHQRAVPVDCQLVSVADGADTAIHKVICSCCSCCSCSCSCCSCSCSCSCCSCKMFGFGPVFSGVDDVASVSNRAQCSSSCQRCRH